MRTSSHTLRVAVLYRGAIHREETFGETSAQTISFGTEASNEFVAPEGPAPEHFELFERTEAGYDLRVPEGIDGTLDVGGAQYDAEEFIRAEARREGTVATADGDRGVYLAGVAEDDWGLLRFGDVEVYFQVLEADETVAGRGWSGIDRSVVGTVLGAAALHAVFLLLCFVAYDRTPNLERGRIARDFVGLNVANVDHGEPSEPKQPKKPRRSNESGDGDADPSDVDTSEVSDSNSGSPEHDTGPPSPDNVGVNKILGPSGGASGPMANLIGEQSKFSEQLGAAMDGASVRGSGRGSGIGTTGTGGGGSGFGEAGDVGEMPGGNRGTPAAGLGDPEEREVEGTVDPGNPTAGSEFCNREDIRKVVSARSEAIRYCYEKQIQTRPDLSGKVVVQWKIGLEGRVTSTSVAESTVGVSELESCLLRTIRSMRFEKPEGGVCVVQYPFSFSSN